MEKQKKVCFNTLLQECFLKITTFRVAQNAIQLTLFRYKSIILFLILESILMICRDRSVNFFFWPGVLARSGRDASQVFIWFKLLSYRDTTP